MNQAQEFQARAARVNQGRDRTGWRYPQALQRLAVDFCREQREAQRPFARIARELGVNVATLGRWLRKSEPSSELAPKFREVVVTETKTGETGALVAVLPSGLRIEGLALGEVLELARVLR